MKRIFTLATGLLLSITLSAQKVYELKPTEIITGQRLGTTPPVSSFPPAVDDEQAGQGLNPKATEVANFQSRGVHGPVERNPYPANDPLWKPGHVQKTTKSPGSSIILNQDDFNYTFVHPPDPVLDAGPNHVLTSVNGGSTKVNIYNKSGVLLQQINMNTLWQTVGQSGLGDPIIMYDAIADRWLLTEFSSSGNRLLMAVSVSSDPLGSYYIYSFNTPQFPDYPKYSVWPDAYYVTTNEGSSAFYAVDRNAMINGMSTVTIQRFSVNDLPNFGFQSLTPVSMSGVSTPPSGTPATFWRHVDDEAHFPNANDPFKDYVEYWTLVPDFNNTNNSVLTGPHRIDVSDFDSDLNGYFAFSAIRQPNSNTRLDPLREVFMNKMQYRNFGAFESIVACHVTDLDGNDNAGMRWYEFRKTGNSGWSLYQEGTYGPDLTSRWMGSISINKYGSIVLAYSVSNSTNVYPGLRYTARISGDSLGKMTLPEELIVSGSSPNSNSRYGDYATMSVDPADDSTFWFTGEYNPSSSWKTRLVHIAVVDSCKGLTANVQVNSSSLKCFGDNNASVQLTGLMGTGGTYEYNHNGSAYQSSGLFTGLGSGTHYFTVKQGNCVSVIGPYKIDGPDEIIVNTGTSGVDCPGDTNGMVFVTASGGTGSLKFSIDSVNWTSNNVFSNLSPGYYTVYVKDDSNCVGTRDSVLVVEPDSIAMTFEETAPSAPGQPDGEVIVHATGGTTPYLFSLDSLSFQQDSTFTSLIDSVYYTVYIKDNNQCTGKDSFMLSINTGIEKLFAGGTVKLYPNPTKGAFIIEISSNENKRFTVKLNDISGKLLHERSASVRNGKVRLSFDLTGYAQGIYILHISDGKRQASYRIMKE